MRETSPPSNYIQLNQNSSRHILPAICAARAVRYNQCIAPEQVLGRNSHPLKNKLEGERHATLPTDQSDRLGSRNQSRDNSIQVADATT